MVKPSQKKEAVVYLRSRHKIGLVKICRLIGIAKSSHYYKSKLDDSEVIKKLKELAEKLPTRGFDEYYYRIRREGLKWSRNRVLRVYRSLGMVRRKKPRKQLPAGLRQPLFKTSRLNEVWSMDFMSDSLIDGRTFRSLNVIDDYNRECLLGKGSLSYPSLRVLRELERLIEIYGKPQAIRTDNGPEFISEQYRTWCDDNNITRLYSNPGKPMENGYIERFNRTLREDLMDPYLFTSINQFNMVAEKIIYDYNYYHPHKSLGRKSPVEFGQRDESNIGLINPIFDSYNLASE